MVSLVDPQALHWLVVAFQEAQARRLALGEQIRSVLQGRTTHALTAGDPPTTDASRTLEEIGQGQDVARVPILGAQYARAVSDEHELHRAVRVAVRRHPVWRWLKDVRGVGELLAARLIALLDLERARHPSSFWAFCGLGTVAATTAICERCGGRRQMTNSELPPTVHRAPDGSSCVPIWRSQTVGAALRIAQPGATRARKLTYSPLAKQTCYLIGVSFTRQGTTYRRLYETYRAELDLAHPDWPAKRRYLSALRYTEKRFLVHLWVVWRALSGAAVPGDTFESTLAEAWAMADRGVQTHAA